VIEADLSDPAAARAMVTEAIARLGRLDGLVNNAATIMRKSVLDLTDDDLRTVLAMNVGSYFACAQEVAWHLVARGAAGSIVMVSSVNQDLAVQGQAAYCASKGAVRQLAHMMALELAPHRVRVNLFAPGTVETDLNQHLLADAAFRTLREAPIPGGHVGAPGDMTGAAIFF